jgi:hypothetical protein
MSLQQALHFTHVSIASTSIAAVHPWPACSRQSEAMLGCVTCIIVCHCSIAHSVVHAHTMRECEVQRADERTSCEFEK